MGYALEPGPHPGRPEEPAAVRLGTGRRDRGLARARAQKPVGFREPRPTSARPSGLAGLTDPPRLLSRSRVKRQPIPEAFSAYGDETRRTAQAPASLDDPGGPGGQRPRASSPRPFPPRRPPDRLYVTFPFPFQTPIRYRWLARGARRSELRRQ